MITWSRQSRRIDPISLSTQAHCQGLAGAEDLLNLQASDSLPKLAAVNLVPISQQVTRGGIFWKGLDHLLPCPPRRRMLGHVEMEYPSETMSERYQHK
jgi:hypothetical protein